MTEAFWLPLVACALTLAVLRLLLGSGWAGHLAIDQPNELSLHSSAIPRAGGLCMIPAALVSSLFLLQRPTMLLALSAVLCAVSFIDDRWGLPVFVRLVCHLMVAIALCQGFQSSLSPLGIVLAIVCVVWAANLFNFMDGTDGLAAGMAILGFGVFGWTMLNAMPTVAILAICMAAAAAGFLVFNFSPARVFMGDAGSVPLGFLAGAIGLTGWLQNVWPIWFPLLVFSPFMVDASVTLVRRMLNRERFWQAHRDHYYQRLVRMGWSHRRLALAEYALMAACGGSALALLNAGAVVRMIGLSAWLATYLGLMLLIDNAWAKRMASRGEMA